MIVGVPNEGSDGEHRVSLIPPHAERLVDDGHHVVVEAGAGESAGWSDGDYEAHGAEILEGTPAGDQADILLHVQGPDDSDEPSSFQPGQAHVGLLGAYDFDEAIFNRLRDGEISAFALELLPRISRAQSMDANSSMSSIGGYKAAVMAAERLPKMFPMEMTAAGTVQPADVFVIGAGIAGLKAMSTANRLGASVKGYDIRLETREQVQSVGGEFVELDLETEESGDDEGYAREMDEEFYRAQREAMNRVVPESDVVISTAAIPGRPAPELVSEEMVKNMAAGSVIIDVAAATGGNCEITVPGETIEHSGVTIVGPTNLPARVAHHASQLYSNNMYNFVDYLITDDELDIDTDDEIIDQTLITHAGEQRWVPPSAEGDEE